MDDKIIQERDDKIALLEAELEQAKAEYNECLEEFNEKDLRIA